MKICGRIVKTIYILCGILLVVGILFIWANQNFLETYNSFIKNNINKIGLGGTAVLIFGIIYLVNWFDFLYRNRSISFDNPGGKVRVSLSAIEEFITSRISTQNPGVENLKVVTSLSARGLETNINLQLLAGTNIPETCASIQEITKNYLQDVVGVERVAGIEIFVSNIIVKEKAKPLQKENEEET